MESRESFLKRESEIKRVISGEIENYLSEQREFSSNPLYWTNNRRRMMGLPVLRGFANPRRFVKHSRYRISKSTFGFLSKHWKRYSRLCWVNNIANLSPVNGEEIIEEKERSHDNG